MRPSCWAWALTLSILVAGRVAGQEYRVGVGRADITPDSPIWLAGYGDRNKPSEGVEQPLLAKCLTIRHGKDAPLVLITADILGIPEPVAEVVAGRINAEFQVPRGNVMLVASHTHTGPVVAGKRLGMFDLADKEGQAIERYTRKLETNCFTAAAEALAHEQPAKLTSCRGKATFAANRRVFRPNGVDFGVNPTGVVDHDVPVLRVDNLDGSARAIVFSYACHCTTLTGSCYRVGGDWAGYAQDYLERAHPGATALFVTGCGGDANPEPRGKLEFARQHGLEMAGAVSQALTGKQTPVHGALNGALARVALPIAKPPSREEYQKRLESKDHFIRRHARRMLDILDKEGRLPASYPCALQVWKFGKDLTVVAIGGEVVVDYALRLKRELPNENLWVAAYANDVLAYIPSVRILIEGGYEADTNLLYYGLPTRFNPAIEDTLIKKVHEMVGK